ncbi:MAG: fibronectin type III domain-containing protein, partial [Patescibacteria group bacterium]
MLKPSKKMHFSAALTAGFFVSVLGLALLTFSTVLAVDLPDLTIDSIVVTPSSPQTNQNVSIVVTGRNAGVLSLTDSTGLDSYTRVFDNFTFSTSTEPTVNPVPTTTDPLITGELFTYTWTGMFTSTGTQNLLFTVDTAINLIESNETNNTATSTVTVVAPPDTTAPVITGPTVANLTATSTTINWTTNEAGTSSVQYGLTSAYGSSVATSTLVTSHSLLLTGLTASTTYHFMVSSADAVGNTATSSDQTFKTNSVSHADDDDDDDDEDGDDDDDNAGKVQVCHYNKGSKGYSLI